MATDPSVDLADGDLTPGTVPQHRRPSDGVAPVDALRLALDAGGLGTWRWDAATGITVWDRQMASIFGVGPQWPGTYEAWVSLLHPQDRDAVVAEVQRALAEGGRYEVRHRVVWPDGSVHWIEGLGQVLPGPDGRPVGTIGCARDITDRVSATLRASQLQQVTADLAAALTVDELARVVGRHMQATVGAASGAVALLTPDGRHVRMEAWFGYGDEVVRDYRVLPMDAGVPLVDAVRSGRPVFLQAADVPRIYPAVAEANRRIGSTSLVALPLSAQGSPLGGLVFGFVEPQPLDDVQRAFFEALAAQVGQAVSRSLLVQQLREVTRELQAGLAPGDLPDVPGLELTAVYRPGGDDVEEIGGDWFDVVPLGSGGAAFVVGDVMGRGVRASTTMTRLRASVRAFLSVDPDPVSVVRNVDGLVVQEELEDFVTLLCGVLDPVSGEVTYVNAGHMPPMLAEPGVPAMLEPPWGPPLGLTAGPRPAATVRLPVGAVMLLFTDGLVERAGRDLDEGVAALAEQAAGLRPDVPLAAAVAAVTTALAPRASDDVTVLALRRTGAAAPTSA